MLVIYKTDTLEIEQCVTVAADDFRAMIEATPGLGLIETEAVSPPHAIAVVPGADGPTLIARKQLDIFGPDTCPVDQAATFVGIPEGAVVSGDAGSIVMDASGELEISFETAGTYVIAFSHPAYLRHEVILAVTA